MYVNINIPYFHSIWEGILDGFDFSRFMCIYIYIMFGLPMNHPGCNRHILFDHVFRVPGEGWSLDQCALGDLMLQI